MSNQLVQSGSDPIGYLDKNFRTFNANSGQYRFKIFDRPTLDVSSLCPVGIFKSPDGNVYVDIDADAEDLETFDVRQSGNTVIVKQKSNGVSNGNISIGNVSISGGGNSTIHVNGQRIEIRNGRTYVNGVDVTSGGQQGKPTRQPKIRIFTPEFSDLEANMSGEAVLASAVVLNDAEVDVSEQSFVALAVRNLEFDLSGQSASTVIIGGGELNVDLSGQGSVKAQGNFSSVKVDLSGMGSMVTSGTCAGNYKASVSGMGSITHRGEVHGCVKKSMSGMGSINI